jgi:hypothetical protein
MSFHRGTDVTVERFGENPLITPASDERIGSNINGPSIIRVPHWIEDPLGEYYMYFAHHGGEYIRLAYADDLRGPWEVHPPGSLQLEDTQFDQHIASPDVHVDDEAERIRLYFHGCCGPFQHPDGEFGQVTDVATSTDGIEFTVRGESIGAFYFRVWEYADRYYAVANDGHLYSSADPLSTFERHHQLFSDNRHFAVRLIDDELLQLFMTRIGDRPERIQVAVMDLSPPVEEWQANPHPPKTVLWPKRDYEGGNLPIETSEPGAAHDRTRALRDPAIFEEDGRAYVFYAIAGEHGIAGADLH